MAERTPRKGQCYVVKIRGRNVHVRVLDTYPGGRLFVEDLWSAKTSMLSGPHRLGKRESCWSPGQ